MADQQKKPLSVEAVVRAANKLLAPGRFRVVGEVSEVSNKRSYKAVYFTIKDERAILPCMMWRNRFVAAGVPLDLGSRVVVDGSFDYYGPSGRLSFHVSRLTLEGEGDIRARVARLAAKLSAEGLTSPDRKRPLVMYPERVGLVTSPNGAAVHDVLRTMRRRCPSVRVLLAGVRNEGKGAPESMIAGLQAVVEAGAEEVLLVRGGGSFENLMPFNDEGLARAIAACPVPVITGIGHEHDTFIADMVGDLRCTSPTAAADSIMPHQQDLLASLDTLRFRATRSLTNRLRRSEEFVEARASRPVMVDPMSMFATDLQMTDVLQASLERGLSGLVPQRQERVDVLRQRLVQSIPNAQREDRFALEGLESRLRSVMPVLLGEAERGMNESRSSLARAMEGGLDERSRSLDVLKADLGHAGAALLGPYQQEAALVTSRLNDLSPLRTLERGWSIAKDGSGSVVSSVSQVGPGDKLSIQVKDGVIHADVSSKQASDLSEFILLEE